MTTHDPKAEGKSADKTLLRRGLLAAAWAAVTGLVLRQTTQPVQAAAAAQFSNLPTDFVVNSAQNTTKVMSVAGFPTADSVLVGQAFAGSANCGIHGASGVRSAPTMQCGVFGAQRAAVSPSAAVFGDDDSGVGGGSGLLGQSKLGLGVLGQIPATSSANTIAIYALNYSTFAGPGPGAGGFGVYGLSAKGHGLVGATATAGGAAVVGATNGVAGAFGAAFYGPVIVGGDFTVFGGAKSAAVPHPDGSHRRLYCVESPESWFEDFGKSTLECGRAEVVIDPDFAAVADLTDYHVFLTDTGDHRALSVKTQTPRSFTVEADMELASLKGKNVASLTGSFNWRIVARRKDIEGKRFAPVTLLPEPALPPIPPAATVASNGQPNTGRSVQGEQRS